MMNEGVSMHEHGVAGTSSSAQATYRLIDRPELTGYRVKAVVDWIDVEFSFSQVRSVYALRRSLGASHVHERTASMTRGTEFRARLQDPKSAWDVQQRLAALHSIDVRVTGVEIAVDLYPLNAEATKGMPTMSAHLLRGLKNPMDFARFGKAGPGIDQLQSFEASVRQFDAGHTCYLGHQGDRHQQRLYVKRTNDSGKQIPVAEHRVRIENTYFAPEGFDGDIDGLITEVVGKNDFAFRRMVTPDSAMKGLLVSRIPQAGARAVRSDRTLYDRNTEADTQLNRRAYDSLRALGTRWAKKPDDAEIAGHFLQMPLCGDAQSDYYTSVNTEFQVSPEPGDAQPVIVTPSDASRVKGRSNKFLVSRQGWKKTMGKTLMSATGAFLLKPVMEVWDSMRSNFSKVRTVVQSGSYKFNTNIHATEEWWSLLSVGLLARLVATPGI